MTVLFTYSTLSGRGAADFCATKPHQCVDAKWFDTAALNQFRTAMCLRPCSQSLEWEFRTQPKLSRPLCEQAFDRGRKPSFRVKMVNQDNLPARTDDSCAFRQDAFRIFDQRDDELSDDAIKRSIRICEPVRIHDNQVFYERISP